MLKLLKYKLDEWGIEIINNRLHIFGIVRFGKGGRGRRVSVPVATLQMKKRRAVTVFGSQFELGGISAEYQKFLESKGSTQKDIDLRLGIPVSQLM